MNMTTNALPNQFSWNSYKVTNGYRLYDLQVGSTLIKIAVIDSGYDPNHSEITGNIDKKNLVHSLIMRILMKIYMGTVQLLLV